MKKNKILIEVIIPQSEQARKVDELMWQILWEPLGLSKEIQNDFNLDGYEMILAIKDQDQFVGGLIAYQTSTDSYELRHIGIRQDYRACGLGTKMLVKLETIVRSQGIANLHAIARNASRPFFEKNGFVSSGEYLDHPDFLEHEITFVKMQKGLMPNSA
ncbi:MAG: GNAT family N-acetyltransferase [Candidatus Omnitrophica bacterium]|nr:GNAT family N-acetyltransferase [Candidatus Omnitrophota bacterium]